MLINGAVGLSDDEDFYLIITIVGAIFFGMSIILLGKLQLQRYFIKVLYYDYFLQCCSCVCRENCAGVMERTTWIQLEVKL